MTIAADGNASESPSALVLALRDGLGCTMAEAQRKLHDFAEGRARRAREEAVRHADAHRHYAGLAFQALCGSSLGDTAIANPSVADDLCRYAHKLGRRMAEMEPEFLSK
jgi:hypothetical protein